PSTPHTPPISPRPMSLVQSPGQVPNRSGMSMDPPTIPLHSSSTEQLYDIPAGTLATWGLQINRRLKALICMTCQAVVQHTHVANHMTRQHKDARVAVDKALLANIVRQEGIVDSWPDISIDKPVEFEGLERKWGVGCPACPAMFQHARTAASHAVQIHQLSLPNDALPRNWMQRFSHAQGGSSWFAVVPRSAQLHSPAADYLIAVRKELNTRPPLPAADLDHRHISPWHVTTRWLQYLEGKDVRQMRALIEPPKESDQLFYLVACTRRYMEASYDLILQSSEVCLQILNTDTQTEDYNHHPFGRHQLDDTLRAYTRLVLQLVCFLLRAEAELDLPAEVKALVVALRQALNQEVEGVMAAIHQLLLGLWMREWTPTRDNQFPDPTVRFVIHTQVNVDGSLKKPEEVTGVFAKLMYDMRLTFLYECHQCLDSPGQPSLVVSARTLRPWFTKGLESTFHTLKSLQHRASSITMSSQNEPNMVWKDKTGFTTLIYMGHEVSLDALRKCQGALEDETRTLLVDTLLFGHPFHINIPSLCDDMGNKQPGYSLFTDRVNTEALGPVDQLADHVLRTPALNRRFVMAVREGKVVWNAMAMSAWLNAFARLNLLCLIQAEMNCGAPGRTTELTAMPTANTPGGMLRALRIIDNHVVLMRTYHKMRAAQGFDRVIPHSLNAALAAVFIYKEAICRPFAQLCASVLYPGDVKVKALYQDFLFVNYDKPFIGDDISAGMKRWTGEHLGVELGIQKWRQCSTPLRRKHAGLEEMWLEDQDTVDAAQAGHSHRVDTLRYGVTDLSSTGMAEDYIGPFLKTSVMWHRVLHLVPGGELLPLHVAGREHFQAAPERPLAAPQQGFDAQAVLDGLKEQLEPRLSSIERKIEEAAASTRQELKGLFDNLKTLLAGVPPAPPAPASPPLVPRQPSPVEDIAPPAPLQAVQPIPLPPPVPMPAPPAPPIPMPAPSAAPPPQQEALQALRDVLHNPKANWSNEGQKLAVKAGLEWRKDVVVILPTGSGKSAIISTIVKLEKLKVTAVLCPLRSLLSDWQRRLTRLGAEFEVFNPQNPVITGQAPLVLVSLDVTTRGTWRQAVASMRPEVQLNRYVIDEAHLLLTESGYRDIMRHVKELRETKVQMMLLSATIPPICLAPLRVSANLAQGNNTHIIRACSNRPELFFGTPVIRESLTQEVSQPYPFNIAAT
ncbi:hypothetical protein C8Q77DRAFT_1068933, partial [Trametes polyzona]